MAVDTYMAFIPSQGTPLVSESQVANVPKDPFPGVALNPNNWFEINDWSFDVEQTLNIGSQSGGAGAGKVTFNPLSVTRKVDRASQQFFTRCASGTPFKYVDLLEVKSAGAQSGAHAFIAWRFTLCAIKSVGWSYDEESPVENLSFEYGGIEMQYYLQDPKTGTWSPLPPSGWDRIKNVQT